MKDSQYQKVLKCLRVEALARLHKSTFGDDRPQQARPKRNRLGRQDARRT